MNKRLKLVNRLLLLVVPFLLIVSCSKGESNEKNDDSVKISGTVRNPQDGLILLQELQDNVMTTIDTLHLNNKNAFETTVNNAGPGFYRLNLYDKQFVNFILDDENVEITADGASQEGIAEVKGSTDTDHFNAINDIMKDFQKDVQELETAFQQATLEKDQAKIDSLRAKYVGMEEERSEAVKEEINKMENSIAALYAANFLDPEKNFPFFDSLAKKFGQELPNSAYTKQFVEMVNNMRTLAIGSMAPEIALPNPEGDTVKLSSLRGNYVLIDFWAAWCRPCRMENPNVVRMYHKYNDKGFEVFGVSLDKNREDWLAAIENDGLVWTQVSDLQYFNSAAASLYNIQAIPATFLIDPDGKIIAKNLRGAALEEKLAELL